MKDLSKKEQKILEILLKGGELQSSDVHSAWTDEGEEVSLVTVKRTLSKMVEEGLLKTKGAGRSTSYELTTSGRVFVDIETEKYLSEEPDKRFGLKGYNFELFSEFPSELFNEEEMNALSEATCEYDRRTDNISSAVKKKELERLIIELSWKSSKIEGNTYTLLDTENLILRNITAKGKTKEETQMILNHKEAFDFVYKNRGVFKTLTKENLRTVHDLVVKDLDIDTGFRKSPVGISGSVYRPLDNVYQIEDAVERLSLALGRVETTYAKALLVLLGISYIQPFDDGNKRVARIITDAVLLSGGLAPLSYRSVDPKRYKEAMLLFYEINSVIPFKRIFIEQYDFAAKNYAIK